MTICKEKCKPCKYATDFGDCTMTACQKEILVPGRIIDVLPKRGHVQLEAKWQLASDGDGVVCSNCGEDFCNIIYEVEKFKFCPNCGASMSWEKSNDQPTD